MQNKISITVIGVSDKKPDFSDNLKELILQTENFAGGERHKKLVNDFLPKQVNWHEITVPLSAFFCSINNSKKHWVIFASGDPLFFGIGNTLRREFPDAEINVIPYFNSLQMLAHRMQLPYGMFQTISLTGRSWYEFDKALIQGVQRMGILTDRKKTPSVIAARLLEFNYSNYKMYYGERIGGVNEKIRILTLQEAVEMDFNHPNCFFIEMTDVKIPHKGGVDEMELELLLNRPKMVTKMPVRMTTLSLMHLENKTVFWDIGACTGSISIDAKLNYPHLNIVAFEKRPESKGIIERNMQRFQALGIELIMGDYLDVDKKEIEKPNAVFIGGYGGDMDTILNDVDAHLSINGVLAFNSVCKNSMVSFIGWCNSNNYEVKNRRLLTVDEHNPINILVAIKLI